MSFHPNKIIDPDQILGQVQGRAWVQWRIENIEEVARFLEDFHVALKPTLGHGLLIRNRVLAVPDIHVRPGDILILDDTGRALGHIRAPAQQDGDRIH